MEKFLKRPFYVVIFLLILFISCDIKKLLAISITPSRGEVFVEPNKKYVGEYLIGNTEGKDIKVMVFPEQWLLREGRDATSWIETWPKEVTIPAHSSKKINFSVKPEGKVEGEYTTSLIFRSVPLGTDATMEVVSQIRLGMCVVIKGTEIIKGEISRAEVLDTNPLKIIVNVKNDSNIHIRPKGKIDIMKIEKSKTGSLEKRITELLLNPIDGSLYPETEGDIGPKSDIKLEPGRYKAKIRIEFGPDILTKEIEFKAHAVKK